MSVDLSNLNPEQRAAVTHKRGPLLIVAGAGTGKTTVITQRVAWLLQEGKLRADQVLALTFTDKASGEMAERIDAALPYGSVDTWVMTFHAFAERILKAHAIEIGLPNNFKLLTQTEQWLLVRQQFDRFTLKYYRPLGNPTKFIHALIRLFSRAKDEVITPEEYLAYAEDLRLNTDSPKVLKSLVDPEVAKALKKKERQELLKQEIEKINEVANAYHVYQQLLLEQSALDFGDLINYCLRLFQQRPAILAQYRNQFEHILVDEFQDTNYAQYELVRLLAAPRNNITVVGDDDQSVYKFRGASVSNILEFKRDYPKAKEIFLTSNYRSTQDVLDLSYAFICQNNPNRLEVKLAQQRQKSKKADDSAPVLSKKLVSTLGKRGVIKHTQYTTAEAEVRGVIRSIIDLKQAEPTTTWSDFAILARTNDVAGLFVSGLSQTDIPFQFVASRGLYTKSVIIDILSYLRLLDNYHESVAMYRVLTLPCFDLAANEINQVSYWANRKGWSLFQALRHLTMAPDTPVAIRNKFKTIVDLIEKHSALAKIKSAGEVVLAFLEDSGYLKMLTKRDTLVSRQAVSYVDQFYKKIKSVERGVEALSVRIFLNVIDLELEAGDEGNLEAMVDDGPESVKVMTVHAAKGLEFRHVFVVTMVDRRFPTDDRSDPISLPVALIKEILPDGDVHLQEERRLLYVAMTRARYGLYFSSAVDYGGQRKKKPSRFLFELAELGFQLDPSLTGDTDEPVAAAMQPMRAGVTPIADQLPAVPAKFSFTQLKAFDTCPYQYRFAHILRVPVRGKAQFSFGKTIHSTMQKFFELVKQRASVKQISLFDGPKPLVTSDVLPNLPHVVKLEELLKLYEENWIDDWYASERQQQEFKEKGKKAITAFYKDIAASIPVPRYLELPFNLKLTDADGSLYTVKGVIDRIDAATDGGLEIIDYKTGEGKTEAQFQNEDREQLLIYQLAAEQVLGERVSNLYFYYIEPNRKISFLGSPEDLDAVKEKILTTIREIKKGHFPPKPGPMCRFCDFQSICDYRQV